MTIYRTCAGCVHQHNDCEHRSALAIKIKGLMITSVKWRCANRKDRFSVGDAVWVRTIEGGGGEDVAWADFPAIVVRLDGNKALVFIDKGAPDEENEYRFEPRNGGNGFCKLPLSRIRLRTAAAEKVCRYCQLPAHAGHRSGFSCSPIWADGTPKAIGVAST